MSDLYHFSSALLTSGVRMAYTLDNNQPVKCTLVSEEPLFYLDTTPAEIDEDDFSEFADFDFIQETLNELDHLKNEKITTPDDDVIYNISPESVTLFKEQFAPMGSKNKPSHLTECLNKIGESRMGATLIDFIKTQKIGIQEVDQIVGIFYDRQNQTIYVRQNLNDTEKTILIMREMRRVWQQKQGALLHPLFFHPDHAILVNRIQSADLMTNIIRMAWEIKLAGSPDVWAYLEEKGYKDLTRIFARDALSDFRSLNSGRAMAATFEAWFMSERCRAFDRVLIQQMLADYQSYVHSAGHIDTSRVLSYQIIAALGEMPYGNNYLAAHAMTILEDPIFTEIRDRSNANFLWFIKFEQSFKQTERDLQGEDTSPPSVDSSGHAPKTATLLFLPKTTGSFPVGQKRVSSQGSTNTPVIDLDRWRARRPDTI